MAANKYYAEEQRTFAWAYGQSITPREAERIFADCKREWGFEHTLRISARKAPYSGVCNSHEVVVPTRGLSLGLLIHEIAHAIQFKNYVRQYKTVRIESARGSYSVERRVSKRWHSKEHMGLMAVLLSRVGDAPEPDPPKLTGIRALMRDLGSDGHVVGFGGGAT